MPIPICIHIKSMDAFIRAWVNLSQGKLIVIDKCSA